MSFLANYFSTILARVSVARKIGVAGLSLAALHIFFVLRVLTKSFDTAWQSEHVLSLSFAKAGIVVLFLSFIGLLAFFAKKLGNKKELYIQTFGYLGFLFILLHTLFFVKPPHYYYALGQSFLNYSRQGELTFIVAFLIVTFFLRIFAIFLDRRGVSLQLKIVIHTFIYFAAIVLIFGTYVELSNVKAHSEKTLKSNKQSMEVVRNALNTSGITDAHKVADSISKSTGSETAVLFLDENKIVVYDSEAKEEGRKYTYIIDQYLTSDKKSWEIDYKRGNNEYHDLAIKIEAAADSGYLVVSADYSKSNPGIYQTLSSYGLIALTTFLMAMFTLTFARKNIIGPVKKLTKASQKIAEGNFDTKIDIEGRDEFAALSKTYNDMTTQIHGQIQELRELDRLKDEFIAIVSHNLRTPLTTLRGYIEFLDYGKVGRLNRQQKYVLSKAQDSTNTLLNLSEGLLSVTALEGGKVKVEKEPLDAASVLKEILKELDFKIKDRRLTLEEKLDEDKVMILGDKVKLKQAFVSIIENAIKFNKEGGKIIVDNVVEKAEHKAVFIIKDTGIGISKAKQKDAFKKFNRATGVYAYSYEGMGLGLHLTRLIILAHEGSIWLESEEGQGTSVFISLPLSAEPSGGKKE